MKYTGLLLCFLVFGAAGKALAQGGKKNHEVSIGFQAGKNAQLVPLAWQHTWGIAWKKRILVGYGVQFSSFYGQGTTLVTKASDVVGMRDTLMIRNAEVHSLNLTFHLEIRPFSWLYLGASLDLAGFSLGPKRTAYIQGPNFPEGGELINTRPQYGNLFLFGTRDKGSLNSQFFLKFWPTDFLSIKLGYSIYHVNYVAAEKSYFIDPKMAVISLGFCPSRWSFRNN